MLLYLMHDYFRIILSGILALMVSMPMCVCGDSFLSKEIEREHTCCPLNHCSEEPDTSHDCELSHHEDWQFISSTEKVSFLKKYLPIFIQEREIEDLFSSWLIRSSQPLRAPPDRFSGIHPPQRVIYCQYRL